MTIYLLKSYKEYGAGEIIEKEDTLAKNLIAIGVARVATNRDFLVKPDFGSHTKAFGRPPFIRKIKHK
jgi:hypothetical protein